VIVNRVVVFVVKRNRRGAYVLRYAPNAIKDPCAIGVCFQV